MDDLEMIVNADRMWTSIKTFAFFVGLGGAAIGSFSYGTYCIYHAIKDSMRDRKARRLQEAKPVEMKFLAGLDKIDFRKPDERTQESDKKTVYALKEMNVRRDEALLPDKYLRN